MESKRETFTSRGRLVSWWQDLSLFWKLSFPFLIFTLLVGPLFTGVWLKLEAESFRAETIRRGEGIHALLASQVSTAVALGDRTWLKRIVSSAVRGTDLTYCAVYDEGGKILASSVGELAAEDRTLEELTFRPVEFHGPSRTPLTRIRYLKTRRGEAFLEVEAPLLFFQAAGSDEALFLGTMDGPHSPSGKSPSRVGFLRLGMSLTAGEVLLQAKSLRQLAVIFFFALVGMAILAVTIHSLVVPLGQMADGALRVARGNLDEMVKIPSGRDEVGALAEAFNFMVGRLRRSRSFNDLVGANIPLGLVVVDREGRLLEGNEPFLRMLSADLVELPEGRLSEHVEIPDFDGVLADCRICGERRSFRARLAPSAAAGKTVLLEGVAVALPWDQEKESRVMVVLRDVTRIEEARDREQQFERRLLESSHLASLGQLAAGAAHEFNNILQIVTNYVEISMDELDDDPHGHEDLRDNLRQVLRGTERASQIISRMLAFARRLAPCRSRVSLAELVEETLDLVNLEFANRGVEVHTEFRDAPYVLVDAGQIQQVLINLIQNAFHAMTPGGGSLTLETAVELVEKEERSVAVIRVRDTGRGIDENDLPRIFDPFFSTKGVYARNEAERRLEGTGLGLALSYGIIGSHDGEISVESEAGRGSCFIVRLPLYEELGGGGVVETEEVELPEEGRERALEGLRILVVDDEKEIVRLVTRFLLGRGAREAVGVHDSEEALLRLRRDGPWHVLVSDVLMPGTSGLDLARTALSEELVERIVMVTGKYTRELRDECDALGVHACLPKPLRVGALVEVLAS